MYLNMKVNQDVSNYVTHKDGVIKKDDNVEVNILANNDINNMKGMNM